MQQQTHICICKAVMYIGQKMALLRCQDSGVAVGNLPDTVVLVICPAFSSVFVYGL